MSKHDRQEDTSTEDLLALLNDSPEDAPPVRKRPRTWQRPVLLLVVLIALTTVVYGAYVKYGTKSAGSQRQYQVATVSTGRVRKTISASGTLEPWSTVDIKSRAGGRVDALLVNVGDEVTKDQVIARIDPADSLLTYRQAEADVSSAKAGLEQRRYQYQLQIKQSESSIQTARAQLLSTQANLKAAQARLATAKTQQNAQPELTRTAIANAQAAYDQAVQQRRGLDATNPQTLAAAKATYDQAVANRDNAQEALKRQKTLADQAFVSQQTVDTAKATLAVNEAQVASAAARLQTINDELQANIRNADARVAQVKAALEQAKAQSIDVKSKANTTTELTATVLQNEAAVREAEANLQQAIDNRANVAIKEKDIASSEASQARATASLTNAKTSLDQTVVRAPSAGVVLQKYVEQGTIITSGISMNAAGTSIIELGDVSRMYIDVTVDETDIANVETDQVVDVTVDAYPSTPFQGKVTRIDPQAKVESNVTLIHVRVEVDNSEATFKLLKPGMNATCEFVLGSEENVVAVPNDAVREDTDGKFVEIAEGGVPAPTEKSDQSGGGLRLNVTPRRTAVEIGLVGNETTEIVRGVKVGDRIITQTIEPEEPEKAGAASGGGFGPPGMGGKKR